MGGRKPGDYPKTIAEFYRRFPDDEACLRYLVETRWPDGFRCPACGSDNARLLGARRVWQCRGLPPADLGDRGDDPPSDATAAHRVVLGCLPHDVAQARHLGAPTPTAARSVSFGTTWVPLHKLRRAMVNPDRRTLTGSVEVDETPIGGKQAGLKGGRQRHGRKALLVAVAVERREKALGRLRLEVVPDASHLTLARLPMRLE
jgi:hypothetical protein